MAPSEKLHSANASKSYALLLRGGGGGIFLQLTKPVSQRLVLVPSPVWTPDRMFAFSDFYVVKSIGRHPCRDDGSVLFVLFFYTLSALTFVSILLPLLSNITVFLLSVLSPTFKNYIRRIFPRARRYESHGELPLRLLCFINNRIYSFMRCSNITAQLSTINFNCNNDSNNNDMQNMKDKIYVSLSYFATVSQSWY
jgi:hypothetical protein